MDVPYGVDDEGFERLCLFHGVAWKVNGWKLCLEETLEFVTEYLQ